MVLKLSLVFLVSFITVECFEGLQPPVYPDGSPFQPPPGWSNNPSISNEKVEKNETLLELNKNITPSDNYKHLPSNNNSNINEERSRLAKEKLEKELLNQKVGEEQIKQIQEVKMDSSVNKNNNGHYTVIHLDDPPDIKNPTEVSKLAKYSPADTLHDLDSSDKEKKNLSSSPADISSQPCSVPGYCSVVLAVAVPVYTYVLYRVQALYIFQCLLL